MPTWSLQTCYLFIMGGITIEYDTNSGRRRKYLSSERFYNLLKNKLLPQFDIEDAEIEDHSKADVLVKVLALVQILWFVAQAIGRVAQGLAFTTIELFTLGIIVCAVVIFTFCWSKPFEVHRPVVVYMQGVESVLERERDGGRIEMTTDNILHIGRTSVILMSSLTLLTCTVFAGIHVIAWNFHFPTSIEMWLWRASSILCSVLVLIISLGALIGGDVDGAKRWFFLVCAGLYIFCRIYMFVEMFVSLRSVPASVYQTPKWSQYFPAFG